MAQNFWLDEVTIPYQNFGSMAILINKYIYLLHFFPCRYHLIIWLAIYIYIEVRWSINPNELWSSKLENNTYQPVKFTNSENSLKNTLKIERILEKISVTKYQIFKFCCTKQACWEIFFTRNYAFFKKSFPRPRGTNREKNLSVFFAPFARRGFGGGGVGAVLFLIGKCLEQSQTVHI